MANPFKAFMDLRKKELPLALLMFSYFFLVITTFWILKPLKKTLFIDAYAQTPFDLFGWQLLGSQAEQLAKVLNMGVAFAAVIVFTALARSLQRQQLTYIFSAFSAVCFVIFAFLGEAGFTIAFGASIMYLIRRRLADDSPLARAFPSLDTLDRVSYRAIAIGFPIFTIGALIFGAIWAEAAWGNYWSWDPKETWALITWLVYTAYLHTRLVKKLRGKESVVLALVGFLFTIFTFFGVNYLLSGLHSYGGS